MGRITIFIDEDCKDSKQIMSALKQRSIPFEVIDLSEYPERRGDMISLTNQITTPQIFFNETRVKGGADELFHVLRTWEVGAKWGGYDTPLERYEIEIAEQEDPTDPRLQLLRECTSCTTDPLSNMIHLPNRTIVPKGYLSRELLNFMPRDKHKYFINCFTGSQGMIRLMNFYKTADEESAIAFFEELLRHQMIVSLERSGSNHRFDRDNLYRLQPFHHRNILNNLFIWENATTNTEQQGENPMKIILNLSEMMDDLMAMDSGSMLTSHEYKQFEEAVCKLQTISIDQILDDNTRVAFSLDLFNLMTRHFLLERNRRDYLSFWPSKGSDIPKFLSRIKYNVGGKLISAYQVKHLLARGGMDDFKEPSIWTRLCNFNNFNKEPVAIDNRIYFALFLGTRGSPMVRTYRPETLEEDLNKAAQDYCQDEIKFDKSNGIVVLPKVFKWHKADFGSSTTNIMSNVLCYLSSHQVTLLENATNIGGKNKVVKVYQNHAWEPVLLAESSAVKQQRLQNSVANNMTPKRTSGQYSTSQKLQSQRYANNDSPTATLTPSSRASSFQLEGYHDIDDDSTFVPYSIGEMTKLYSSSSVSVATEFNDVLAKGTRNMLEERDDNSTFYDMYSLGPSIRSRQ